MKKFTEKFMTNLSVALTGKDTDFDFDPVTWIVLLIPTSKYRHVSSIFIT